MWRITDGTARDIWFQLAVWCQMPEFFVDASLEVDVDNTIAKPMNLLFYKKRPGFPCGHNIREVCTWLVVVGMEGTGVEGRDR